MHVTQCHDNQSFNLRKVIKKTYKAQAVVSKHQSHLKHKVDFMSVNNAKISIVDTSARDFYFETMIQFKIIRFNHNVPWLSVAHTPKCRWTFPFRTAFVSIISTSNKIEWNELNIFLCDCMFLVIPFMFSWHALETQPRRKVDTFGRYHRS